MCVPALFTSCLAGDCRVVFADYKAWCARRLAFGCARWRYGCRIRFVWCKAYQASSSVCADRICLGLRLGLEAPTGYGELLGCCSLTDNHSSDFCHTAADVRCCISFSFISCSFGFDSCTYGRDFCGNFRARVPGDSLSFKLILCLTASSVFLW